MRPTELEIRWKAALARLDEARDEFEEAQAVLHSAREAAENAWQEVQDEALRQLTEA